MPDVIIPVLLVLIFFTCFMFSLKEEGINLIEEVIKFCDWSGQHVINVISFFLMCADSIHDKIKEHRK